MQGVPVESASRFIPISIVVAIGVLAVAFAVIRRVQGSGDGEVTARRFPPRQASQGVMALIATLVALASGLTILFAERRRADPAGTLGDSLSTAAGATGNGAPLGVMIAIGVLAVVALVSVLLKLRDGGR